MYSFEIGVINSLVLCISEHHVVEQDLLHLTLDILGSSFRSNNPLRGGVYMFVNKDQYFNKTDILHHCKNKIWKLVQFN
jgi:hypothetical protein